VWHRREFQYERRLAGEQVGRDGGQVEAGVEAAFRGVAGLFCGARAGGGQHGVADGDRIEGPAKTVLHTDQQRGNPGGQGDRGAGALAGRDAAVSGCGA
jgi:hypothetical protein